MATFPKLEFTISGLKALLQAQNGVGINFSKIKLGSGINTGPVSELNDLISPVLTLDITDKQINTVNNTIILEALLDNQYLETGFLWREVGIFITDANGDFILYAYSNAGSNYDSIPAVSDARYSKYIRIACSIGSASNVTITESDGLAFVTKIEFKAEVNRIYETIDSLVISPPVTQMDITIPTSGWIADTDTGGAYALSVDIAADGITEDLIPMLTILPGNTQVVKNCEMSTTVRTIDGALRVYAQNVPEAEIQCSLALIDCGKPSEN